MLPEYKINLLNKNKKIIKTIENLENIEENIIKQDNQRKYNKNYIKKIKSKKKYNYQSKVEKNNLNNNKKLVSY